MIIFDSKTKTKLKCSQFLVQKLKLQTKILIIFGSKTKTKPKYSQFLVQKTKTKPQPFELLHKNWLL